MKRGILILAAGASSRMQGRDKLLEDVDGRPLIALMANRALRVCSNVVITLPVGGTERADTLCGLDINSVEVPNEYEGISASIRAGVKAALDCDALMILPADLPELTEIELAKTWDCFDEHAGLEVVRGTTRDGSAGHPVIFPQKYFEDLKSLQGDSGANALTRKVGFVACPLGDNRALTDLDTPEDWADWRMQNPKT